MSRKAVVERTTNETKITLELTLDGDGKNNIFTEIGFFDHMLSQISKHGFIDIFLNVEGDTDVDCHHTVEDVGIVLGKAVSKALGEKEGIRRYGQVIAPMEEALALCVIDISGRPYLNFDVTFTTEKIGELDTEMIEEFFRAVCLHSGMCLHIKQMYGKNNHHIAESIFKAFGRALSQAVSLDERIKGVLSTKGMLE